MFFFKYIPRKIFSFFTSKIEKYLDFIASVNKYLKKKGTLCYLIKKNGISHI